MNAREGLHLQVKSQLATDLKGLRHQEGQTQGVRLRVAMRLSEER